MKHTVQKDLIYNAVVDNKYHPTADFIYNYLKKDNPNLSLATVYRNLNQFAEQGEFVKISIPHSCDVFDSVKTIHYHMVCEKCESIIDIELDALKELDKEIFEKSGFKVSGHNIVIFGICCDCSKKQ